MKVFYAHSSAAAPKQIGVEAALLQEVMTEKKGKQVRVRSGRSDHAARFRGDWEEWQHSVVTRKHATTGQPAYDAFIVSGVDCGRATANILRLALTSGRPVFWWNGQEEAVFKKVHAIEAVDEEDWANGWIIVCRDSKPKQLPLPFKEGVAK
jgi:hypothetical protein